MKTMADLISVVAEDFDQDKSNAIDPTITVTDDVYCDYSIDHELRVKVMATPKLTCLPMRRMGVMMLR